jgi:hypothetical protein
VHGTNLTLETSEHDEHLIVNLQPASWRFTLNTLPLLYVHPHLHAFLLSLSPFMCMVLVV